MYRLLCIWLSFGILMWAGACSQNPSKNQVAGSGLRATVTPPDTAGLTAAVFASGCFWCSEEVFEQLNGVRRVVSGYTGGKTKNPTYQEVSTGATGHAEAIQIWYDPKLVSYAQLLEVFFASHDPTTLNRQGPDQGTQYRSAIFYRNPQERDQAKAYINKLTQLGEFTQPIVTQVQPLDTFYIAEKFHQDYFRLYPNDPYMRAISKPKVDKVKRKFPDRLKPEAK